MSSWRTLVVLVALLYYAAADATYDTDTCKTNNCSTENNINRIFRYPIHNLTDPTTQNLINAASQSLSSSEFYFKIDNFLSDDGLSKLKDLINSDDFRSKSIRRELQKCVFGEKTDYINFPNDTNSENEIHPRNIFVNVKLWTVGARELPPLMIEIFEHRPLLTFLKQIVMQAGKFNNLYLSNDTDGSVYVFSYENGDHGEWHFDQHPFTCVVMLIKPEIGGRYSYYYDNTAHKHDYYEWDWSTVGSILRNETTAQHYVNYVESIEGDMFCHVGNITFHRSEQSFNTNENVDKNGDIIRSILVLSYADSEGFAHDECRVSNDACDNL